MEKKKKDHLKILFIGNSHTYFNDMPAMVADMARKRGFACDVTMIAHGGWYLAQHVEEPDVRFNILYGQYDYIVLQEYSHPFGPEEKLYEAVRTLNQWIREADSIPVIYATWAKKNEESKQQRMNEAHEKIAEEIGAVLAPVGQNWWTFRESHPDIEMYYEDGAHASAQGSEYAAKVIWESVYRDIENWERQLSSRENH